MVIASIDVQGGKVVQLKQGSEKMLERDDAAALAADFNFYGEAALIDLDAAMGSGDNAALVKGLLRKGDFRVGGGIRTVEKAREYYSLGAQKIIVGSRAFEGDRLDEAFLRDVRKRIGRDRLIVAADARGGEIVTAGWKHATGLKLLDVAPALAEHAGELLFTCVEREGTMTGIDMDMVRALKDKVPGLALTAAGGVHTLEEVAALAAMGVDCQLGMALYTGKLSLGDCLLASLKWGADGLVPTILQDEQGQVLTLAYSSRESLARLVETRETWLWSRSRNELWHKGATSGNTQAVLKLRADCDRDALVLTVRPKGPACHTGRYSCFGYEEYSVGKLAAVIAERIAHPQPGSYTATLDDERVREKLLEEANEVVLAKGPREVAWEAADVLYFLTVLLAREKVPYADVVAELDRRHKK